MNPGWATSRRSGASPPVTRAVMFSSDGAIWLTILMPVHSSNRDHDCDSSPPGGWLMPLVRNVTTVPEALA